MCCAFAWDEDVLHVHVSCTREKYIHIYIYSYFSDWLAYSEHNSQHGGFMYLPYLPTFLQYQCRRHINCKMAVVLVH